MLSCTPFLNNSAIVADDGRNTVAGGSLSPGVIAVNSLWINPARKLILEFGHNGLNDLYMPPSIALTMYGYSGDGETDKRDLGTGDISGIPALYGGA